MRNRAEIEKVEQVNKGRVRVEKKTEQKNKRKMVKVAQITIMGLITGMRQ